ncbi:uncharacterized protein AMSG_12335 [Thecamonas trahens ATCC 50062]|uniref:Enoyl reductase (ER) domain-containing protein n=1 Tax=Thecamonas trahens ATCC 50062 TaxID=461836 RepID=A0A0L0DSJ0_THETB|nr:hypothetical protein AMSG_12335 [Thecamonas trahens ATCC 50062]KNC55001.1 hypothetical protein AMSG_12335 [Thecamonas trahens ATCC 50062]|eukprot:XP_013753458.1 hypothetical protein AMSG_12335 [Thecamonas trahens ATCC 50062]
MAGVHNRGLLKGPTRTGYDRTRDGAAASIPSKYETLLLDGAREADGFNSRSLRFAELATDGPPTLAYSAHASLESASPSIGAKGYTGGFVSRTRRFGRDFSGRTLAPGPGAYDVDGAARRLAAKRGSPASAAFAPRLAVLRTDELRARRSPQPGPGAYSVDLPEPRYKKKTSAAFSRPVGQRLTPSGFEVPGPGAYKPEAPHQAPRKPLPSAAFASATTRSPATAAPSAAASLSTAGALQSASPPPPGPGSYDPYPEDTAAARDARAHAVRLVGSHALAAPVAKPVPGSSLKPHFLHDTRVRYSSPAAAAAAARAGVTPGPGEYEIGDIGKVSKYFNPRAGTQHPPTLDSSLIFADSASAPGVLPAPIATGRSRPLSLAERRVQLRRSAPRPAGNLPAAFERKFAPAEAMVAASELMASAAAAFEVAESDLVAVTMSHAALNHRDVWIMDGMYPGIVPGSVLGADGAGLVTNADGEAESTRVVIEPGAGWASARAGPTDGPYRILGLLPLPGTLASTVYVPQRMLHPVPPHLSMSAAAALPLAGVTAWRAVATKAGLIPPGGSSAATWSPPAGEAKRVLVTGAGGGVAQMAVLFAVAAGHSVWVSSSSQAKIDAAVAELGAAGGVLYTEPEWAAELVETAGGKPFDVVIDGAGGEGLNDCIRTVLGVGGVLVHYGATAGRPRSLDTVRLFLKQIELRGTTMGSSAEFADMLAFVAQHAIVPPVSSVTPVTELHSAFATMAAGGQSGKLVIDLSPWTAHKL